MKKILPAFLLTIAAFFGNAQAPSIWFNELVADPGQAHDEYIELHNTSPTGVPLDCYLIVSYFKTKKGNKTEEGVYVYNFPADANIKPLSYYVISSGNPVKYKSNDKDLVYTPTDNTSFSNWNNIGTGGYISKYVYANGTWGAAQTVGNNFNNFMDVADGMDATLLLYKINSNGSTSYVHGFIANPPNSNVSALLTSIANLGALSVATGSSSCAANTASVQLNFGNVVNFDISELHQATGKSQGYAKKGNGYCGNWDKIHQGEFSPGVKNSFATVATDITTVENLVCNSSVAFSIQSGTASFFPMEVQLYTDKGTIGELDAADEYQSAKNVQFPGSGFHTFTLANNQPNLLVYKSATGCFSKVVALNSCTVLPVKFQSFTAARNQQRKEQVLLKWETASEQNNRGFYVQRKVNGQWKNIAFVFSQADNGNSNTVLAYEYKEINPANTPSHYQIQQVDMDGKTSYSEVKTAVGMNQADEVLIYPNPALNGKVNLLFKAANNSKDVVVNDANGRVVKQFRQLTDNSLSIEGLQSGFYTIKIIDHTTGTTTVEKVMIKQ